ncbi:MAG: hypothetical protein PHH61_05580 [Candidatus Nanoarchaeia archaeon]|nr:hypothetical protein [Candidatus Nanoarchaeia archaeon]
MIIVFNSISYQLIHIADINETSYQVLKYVPDYYMEIKVQYSLHCEDKCNAKYGNLDAENDEVVTITITIGGEQLNTELRKWTF